MENNNSELIKEDNMEVEEKSDLINEDCEEDNKEDRKEEQDYLRDLQRVQAEFENFMKRTEIEKKELFEFSIEKLVFKLLSVLDSFELAFKHECCEGGENGESSESEKSDCEDKSSEGMKLIYAELFSVLESVGLSKINSEGTFDPNFHEALITEDGDIDNKIIEELQTGYMLNKKVIRPAKVKIMRVRDE